MPKKKRPGRKPRGEEKIPFQLRLDAEVHERLTKAADQLGVSVNQLVQAICWGVMDEFHLGEAHVAPGGFVTVRERRRCGFFGRPGAFAGSVDEQIDLLKDGRDPEIVDKGELWFGLDFTDRGIRR
jgi:hypothetical protein